MIEVLTL